MTKKEKRIQKLKRLQSDLPLSLVKNILVDNSFELIRSKGSHFHFRKGKNNCVILPVHDGKIKRYYLKDILKALNSHE